MCISGATSVTLRSLECTRSPPPSKARVGEWPRALTGPESPLTARKVKELWYFVVGAGCLCFGCWDTLIGLVAESRGRGFCVLEAMYLEGSGWHCFFRCSCGSRCVQVWAAYFVLGVRALWHLSRLSVFQDRSLPCPSNVIWPFKFIPPSQQPFVMQSQLENKADVTWAMIGENR